MNQRGAQVGFVHAEDHFWSEEEQEHTGNGRAYKSVSLGRAKICPLK